jgi:hypothetical protein
MIEFNLTTEQKKAAFNSYMTGLEMEIYHLLVILGYDPDDTGAIDFSIFAEAEAPSTEYMLYDKYNRYLRVKDKIASI